MTTLLGFERESEANMTALRRPALDSFGTFLETINGREAGGQLTGGSPVKLLITLANAGPQFVPQLMSLSATSFNEFSTALTTLKEAGLVALAGAAGQEQVSLTAPGEHVARLSIG